MYDFKQLNSMDIPESEKGGVKGSTLSAVQTFKSDQTFGKSHNIHGGKRMTSRYGYCSCHCHYCCCNCNEGVYESCVCDNDTTRKIQITFVNGNIRPKETFDSGVRWAEVKRHAPPLVNKEWVRSSDGYERIDPSYEFIQSTNVYAVDWKEIYIVDTGSTSNSWWREYSDGWIVQGGSIETEGHDCHDPLVITFPRPFRDTFYTHNCAIMPSGRVNGYHALNASCCKQTTGVSIYSYYYYNRFVYQWYACGYGK